LYAGGINTEKPAETPLPLWQGLLQALLQRKIRAKFLTPSAFAWMPVFAAMTTGVQS
jgi:hypothetical protein